MTSVVCVLDEARRPGDLARNAVPFLGAGFFFEGLFLDVDFGVAVFLRTFLDAFLVVFRVAFLAARVAVFFRVTVFFFAAFRDTFFFEAFFAGRFLAAFFFLLTSTSTFVSCVVTWAERPSERVRAVSGPRRRISPIRLLSQENNRANDGSRRAEESQKDRAYRTRAAVGPHVRG